MLLSPDVSQGAKGPRTGALGVPIDKQLLKRRLTVWRDDAGQPR